MSIVININKAKEITHNKRRQVRSEEFAPLDIKATIPSEAVAAETERQKIREKYAAIQQQIDSTNSVEVLKEIITSL